MTTSRMVPLIHIYDTLSLPNADVYFLISLLFSAVSPFHHRSTGKPFFFYGVGRKQRDMLITHNSSRRCVRRIPSSLIAFYFFPPSVSFQCRVLKFSRTFLRNFLFDPPNSLSENGGALLSPSLYSLVIFSHFLSCNSYASSKKFNIYIE